MEKNALIALHGLFDLVSKEIAKEKTGQDLEILDDLERDEKEEFLAQLRREELDVEDYEWYGVFSNYIHNQKSEHFEAIRLLSNTIANAINEEKQDLNLTGLESWEENPAKLTLEAENKYFSLYKSEMKDILEYSPEDKNYRFRLRGGNSTNNIVHILEGLNEGRNLESLLEDNRTPRKKDYENIKQALNEDVLPEEHRFYLEEILSEYQIENYNSEESSVHV